jgi:2,4-didehydro-3-deoxy-L-rhamnonate hydrolase
MKLIRFGAPGAEKPGVQLQDGTRIDVSAFGRNYDEAFFSEATPGTGITALRAWLASHAAQAPRIGANTRLGCPIVRPNKIVCIGLNYRDHAAETGAKPPAEPILFFKSTYSLVGPNDDLVIPRGSEKTDWEVELAVIIGKKASYVSKDQAMQHVAGYTLHNDYSERAFQLERGGQWVKGKSCDTFAPLGPFVATADEIPTPGALKMWLRVNGELRQHSSTDNLIFDVPTLVSYISEFMTLLPGDVISTGTPAGVGLGMKPPQFLKPGDTIELGIEKLGESRQHAVAYDPQH